MATQQNMATPEYHRLPTEEPQNSFVFDYKSPFVYSNSNLSYRSIFTYKQTTIEDQREISEFKTNLFEKCIRQIVIIICYTCVILTAPISLFFVVKKMAQFERIVIFRLGRLQPIKGPGRILILPMIDRYHLIDLRMRAFIVPPQLMILSDDSIVEIGAEIRFHIVNIPFSTLHVKDLDGCLRILGRNLLVTTLSKSNLNYIQINKQMLIGEMLEIFNEEVKKWGLEIVQIDLSSITIMKDVEANPALNRLLGALSNSFGSSKTTRIEPAKSEDRIEFYLKRIKRASDSICFKDSDGIFNLKVDQNGLIRIYNFEIKNGHLNFLDNSQENADVVVEVTEDDLIKLFNLELSPLQAYISSKMKIKGDIQLLTKLGNALKSMKIV